MSNIAKEGIAAAKWSTATTVGRFGLQLIAQVVLARLLGPDVYGVFGMGLVIFTFSNFLATFGFSWSLAQLREISEADIRFAFTWQMVVGSLAGSALYFAAPWVAEYFRDPRVTGIVRWMALACVINAAGSVAGNLMRRDMNFRASGLIQLISYAIGYLCIGIPMALLGQGINALVAAWMAQAVVVVMAGYWVRSHPIAPLFVGPQSRTMIRIGAAVFFTNIANWLINSLDRMLIGRFLNAHAMGVYTAGYNLANMPNTLLLGALQPVFLAAGARVQDEPDRLRNAYRQVIATIWVLLLPFFVLLALIAPDVVALLYGPAWTDVSPVLALLFIAMPAFVTWGMSTPVLWNTGRARYEMLLQLPLVPLAVAAFYLLATHGVVVAAAVASSVLVARGAVTAVAAFRVLRLPFKAWLEPFGRGLLLSIALASLVLGTQGLLSSGAHALLRLSVVSIAVAAGTVCLLITMPQVLGTDACSMLIRFAPPLKKWLGHC